MLLFVLLAIKGIRGEKSTRFSRKDSIGKRLSGLLRKNTLNPKNKTRNLLTGCTPGETYVDDPETCYPLYTAILDALAEIPNEKGALSVGNKNGFTKNRQTLSTIKKGSIKSIYPNSRMKKKDLEDDWPTFPTECPATYCQAGCEEYYDEAVLADLTEDDIDGFTAACAVSDPEAQPPAGGGDNPPAGGGDNPPAGGGDNPPAGGGDNPPAGGGDNPPAGGGDNPPAGGGDNPPAGGGDDAPGDDETTKKDADIKGFMIGKFLIFMNLIMVVFYFIL
jgi:hypothetical protein